MRSTRSVSLLPAGSWLPESHKGPFYGLHKQVRGMKGCYRRALLLAAAQARILKITSSQNHMLFFPCCWVLWIKSFRCAQLLHWPPQPRSWSQAWLDNCKADLAVNQITLVRACACARVCTWVCVHLLLQVGRNTITLTFATSLCLQI